VVGHGHPVGRTLSVRESGCLSNVKVAGVVSSGRVFSSSQGILLEVTQENLKIGQVK
jgi:hypothetical protein